MIHQQSMNYNYVPLFQNGKSSSHNSIYYKLPVKQQQPTLNTGGTSMTPKNATPNSTSNPYKPVQMPQKPNAHHHQQSFNPTYIRFVPVNSSPVTKPYNNSNNNSIGSGGGGISAGGGGVSNNASGGGSGGGSSGNHQSHQSHQIIKKTPYNTSTASIQSAGSQNQNRYSMYNYEFAPVESPSKSSAATVTTPNVIGRKNSFNLGERKFVTLSNGTAHTHQQNSLKYITSSFGSLTPRNLMHHQQQQQQQQGNHQQPPPQTSRRPSLINGINGPQAIFAPSSRNKGHNNINVNLTKANASSTSSDAESFLLTDLEYELNEKKNLNGNYKKSMVDKKSFRSPCSVISSESLASMNRSNNGRYNFKNVNKENYEKHSKNLQTNQSGTGTTNIPQANSSSLYNKQENKAKNLKELNNDNSTNVGLRNSINISDLKLISSQPPTAANSQISIPVSVSVPVVLKTGMGSKTEYSTGGGSSNISMKYSKSCYYNRIDACSSTDSLNKPANSCINYAPSNGQYAKSSNGESSHITNSWRKFFANKASSLYYDSGIGADVSQITSSNLTASVISSPNNYNNTNEIVTTRLRSLKNSVQMSSTTNLKSAKEYFSPNTSAQSHPNTKKFQSGTLNVNMLRKLQTNVSSNESVKNDSINHCKIPKTNQSPPSSLTTSTSSSSSSSSSSHASSSSSSSHSLSSSSSKSSTSAQISSFSNASSKMQQRKRLDSLFQVPIDAKKFNATLNHNYNHNQRFNTLNEKSFKVTSAPKVPPPPIEQRKASIVISNDSRTNLSEIDTTTTTTTNNNNNNHQKTQSPPIVQKNNLNININNSNNFVNANNNNNNYNKADFTPKLIRTGAIKTNSNTSIIRKYHLPPPPVVSSGNGENGTNSNSYSSRKTLPSVYQARYERQLSGEKNKSTLLNSTDTYYISPLLYGKTNIKVDTTRNSYCPKSESPSTVMSNPITSTATNTLSTTPLTNSIQSTTASNTNTTASPVSSASHQMYSKDGSKSPKIEIKCIALNDYIALYSKNLTLKKGEKYVLINKENESWYLVRDKHGNTGYAPSNYLECIDIEKDCTIKVDKSHYGKDWFHGNISRSEAYNILVTNQNYNGTFLLRNNSSEKGKYTLCVYKNGKVYNYKVNVQDMKYFIDMKNRFSNLTELIDFYQKNVAGLVCLLKSPAEKQYIDKKSLLDILDTTYKRFIIERNDIQFHEKIGSGQFGIVLKAEYKQRRVVAIKKMKPGSKEDEMNFNREAEFMIKLQSLQEYQHRNLMQFYGLCKDFDDSILIVTEFVKYGSLYNYLIKHKDRIVNSKSRFLRLLNICMDVCDGMEYLESKHIIHRDLATRNCLVGEGEVIKVADFGLARFTDDCYIAHPQSQFPVKWSAPEVIKYRSYSTKSDVWSFSCLMYEVFTLGKMPYGGSTTNSIAAKHIVSGVIPERPSYCPMNLYENIMIKSWNKEPKDRPSFKELLKLLGNFT